MENKSENQRPEPSKVLLNCALQTLHHGTNSENMYLYNSEKCFSWRSVMAFTKTCRVSETQSTGTNSNSSDNVIYARSTRINISDKPLQVPFHPASQARITG